MGYAIQTNGSWRMATPGMTLGNDEVYVDELPDPTQEQVAAALLAEMERVVEVFWMARRKSGATRAYLYLAM